MPDVPNPVENDRCLVAEEISCVMDPALLGRYWRCIELSVETAEVLGIWLGFSPTDAFDCA